MPINWSREDKLWDMWAPSGLDVVVFKSPGIESKTEAVFATRDGREACFEGRNTCRSV